MTSWCLQACDSHDLSRILQALQHLYRHAAEPATDAAYAQVQPLLPAMEAGCSRATELLQSKLATVCLPVLPLC